MLPTKLLSSLLILCVLFVFKSNGQDTFSIVAVDTETGEVGSAGATCLDTVVEGVSAIIISDIIPGVGAIHTQSFWDPANQANARAYLEMGLSAQAVMDSVVANDVAGTPLIRQYGIAIINSAGDAERAAYTGANCFDWKGQFLGGDFAVQGNILLNEDIIDSMATRFFFEEGDLADKLMAAMQGANVPGADSRCLSPQNTSSRSAFIRVARPNDSTSFYLDIIIGATDFGVEPIDVLQDAFNEWRDDNPPPPPPSGLNTILYSNLKTVVKPNPAGPGSVLEISGIPEEIEMNLTIELIDIQGRSFGSIKWENQPIILSDFNLQQGYYIALIKGDNYTVSRYPFSWQNN